MEVRLYVPKKVRSDKFKIGKKEFLDREILKEDDKEIIIGRLSVRVKSDLCRMKDAEKDDREFDHGGCREDFYCTGATVVKEAMDCNNPGWMIAYKSQVKRNRRILVWLLFVALGASSEKEVMGLIGYSNDDARIYNILFASDCDVDEKCGTFRSSRNVAQYIKKVAERSLFRSALKGISGLKRKARFLAYMVKGLLLACTGHRKYDNKEDFQNKRLELASKLLERESKVYVAHARKRMPKAL
ncbi:DNA-directed RNA polymerase D subunit 2b, partial [Mucuna pruriens]